MNFCIIGRQHLFCVCVCFVQSFDDLFLLQENLRAGLLKLYVCNGLLQTLPCGKCYGQL